MNGRNAFFLLVLTLATVIIGEVKANQYRLVTGYLPPWSMTANDHYPGMFIEIMREVDRRMGNNTKIEVFPWGRAQYLAENEPNVILFPLARLPQREAVYSWVSYIKPMRMVFVSNKHHEITEEVARKLSRVMVHKNAPPLFLLQERGFNNLIGVHDISPKIPHMLRRGRADAWFTPKDMADWLWKLNPDVPLPVFSEPLSTNVLYVAGSKQLPASLVTQIERIITDMHEDGTVEAVIQRYKR